VEALPLEVHVVHGTEVAADPSNVRAGEAGVVVEVRLKHAVVTAALEPVITGGERRGRIGREVVVEPGQGVHVLMGQPLQVRVVRGPLLQEVHARDRAAFAHRVLQL
jgi:hypothetical protein